MSTEIIRDANRLLVNTEPLLRFIAKAHLGQIQRETKVDWTNGVVLTIGTELHDLLLTMKYAAATESGQLAFGNRGRAFLGKLLLDLDHVLIAGAVVHDRYKLTSLLASGKNSLTYKAEDQRLGRAVVLKFFRPGRGEGVIRNISRLGRVKGEPVLVNPLDVLEYQIADNHGQLVRVNVLVFPFIEGTTLRTYLDKERNASPVVIQAFIEQTCLAIIALNREGLVHGDLHPNNVMVTTEPNGRAAFRIIDVSYGADEPSDYEYAPNDIDNFKLILRLALSDVQSRLTRISIRRLLGARVFTLVAYILGTDSITFEDVYRELQEGKQFEFFNEQKSEFLRKRFTPPRDFGILRYEEFSDPTIAMSLFYPYPLLFERLCEFGSAVLFGHRGTGKSTYMAAMNFFPQVARMPVDFRDNFGIMFSCRQGEFRKFSYDYIGVITKETQLRIKDILITKIMRKTIGSILEGIDRKRIAAPKSLAAVADLVIARLQHAPGLMISHQLSELDSINSTILQAEINLIDGLFGGVPSKQQSKLLDEHALRSFFEAVRNTFTELSQARFSILFDDAGRPNVPVEVQLIICDLMASSNELYCIKLSAEKKTFEFITSDGKPIERVHDVRVYTISDYLNMGSGFDGEWRTLEEYLRKLVGTRLKVAGFRSEDIRSYLGEAGISIEELVARLASKRGRPEYFGWRTVWQIADRTMRHLIEMISAIFDDAKVTPEGTVARVAPRIQSRQIMRFSNDKLRGLMFLPGVIQICQKKRPLGTMLYEFAASFGRISRHYLVSSKVAHKDGRARFDERLAIEIDNTLNLNDDAQTMLDSLIQYAVIDDERMITALDDNMRKPVYIFNRVYCPVLRISFRRADHWRLSSNRFEKLLLDPTEFIRTDARLKKALKDDGGGIDELF